MGGSLFANEHYNINLYNINFINNVDSFIKSNLFGFGLYFTMNKDYPDSVAYLDGINIVNSLFNSAMIKWVLSKLPKGSEIALGVGLITLAIALIALGIFLILLGTIFFFFPGVFTPIIVAGALLIALGLGILASVSYGIHTGTLGYTHTPDGRLIGWLQGFIATVIIVAVVTLLVVSNYLAPSLITALGTQILTFFGVAAGTTSAIVIGHLASAIVWGLFTGLDIAIMYITDYIGEWIDPSLYRALFFIIFTSMIAYLVYDVYGVIPKIIDKLVTIGKIVAKTAEYVFKAQVITGIILTTVNLGILIITDITHNNAIFFLIISIEFGLLTIAYRLPKIVNLGRFIAFTAVFLPFKLAGTYFFSYFFKQDKMNMAYIVGSIGRIGGPFIGIGIF
jgi:hypothetical protein